MKDEEEEISLIVASLLHKIPTFFSPISHMIKVLNLKSHE